MPLYDISRRIAPSTAVWPGDQPYTVQPVLEISSGASVNLMTLTLSPHTGAHADAPLHFVDGAPDAASLSLDSYIGPARLVTVAKADGLLTLEDFDETALFDVTRLLIRSVVSDGGDSLWPTQFPYLSVALIDYLAAQGTMLIGLDSPSVDAFDSKTLPCHQALYAHGMVNLECLCFAGVPDGDYELIALPLKLAGACASPVRAVLRGPLED